MTWQEIYLVCFLVGLSLSFLSVFGGAAHLHGGHLLGRFHVTHSAHGMGRVGNWLTALNGFTVTAFLCWFGGAGYVLERYSGWVAPLILAAAAGFGLVGALVLWLALFKVLLPQERVLSGAETEMLGVVGRVSDAIRDEMCVGEIIFSQAGARRSAAARSDDGSAMERGTEIVVMRYERGIAYVRRWEDPA